MLQQNQSSPQHLGDTLKSSNCSISTTTPTPTPPNTVIATPPQRPSSPRQFFERLYGHLETRTHKSESDDIDVGTHLETPYQSDGGSVSSPDISNSEERVSQTVCCPAYELHAFRPISTAVAPTTLPFPAFSTDPHISAGFSAFRKLLQKYECDFLSLLGVCCYSVLKLQRLAVLYHWVK